MDIKNLKTKTILVVLFLESLFVLFLFGFVLWKEGKIAKWLEAHKYNVVERKDLSLTYDCEKMDCLRDYWNFAENHKRHASPISEEQLRKELEGSREAKEKARFTPSGEEFRRIIIDILNIDFLVDGIDKRELVVTTIRERENDDYIEKELLFTDEHVGTFDVLLLVPKEKKIGKYPAIIGLHGHNDDNRIFKEKYMGEDLAKAGFVTAMPSFRAMDYPTDRRISPYLLLNGFTLMGVRVYESLLLTKYLKYLSFVDNDKIGVISHSGGSSCANLFVRVSKDIKVQVVDNFIDWTYWGDDYVVCCEIVPGLAYYKEMIDNKIYLPMPCFSVPYCYEDRRDLIINFFRVNI